MMPARRCRPRGCFITALGNRALDALNGELGERPFIAGDAYTIADMSILLTVI
jgi:glutathione S-transferase